MDFFCGHYKVIFIIIFTIIKNNIRKTNLSSLDVQESTVLK